ncbi:hypothetical protein [Halolamina sp.]|uniref:hypothetical protein n=1 Tax=Halolamina sp. TaxID=1940283 RepID=UPI000223BF64|nr:hypothetical protein Halar_2735 [halophilic archaeon DL31]
MVTDPMQGVLTAFPPILLLYFMYRGEIGQTRRAQALIGVASVCGLVLAVFVVVPDTQYTATLGVGIVFLSTAPPALYTIVKERAG